VTWTETKAVLRKRRKGTLHYRRFIALNESTVCQLADFDGELGATALRVPHKMKRVHDGTSVTSPFLFLVLNDWFGAVLTPNERISP
jgi:hypothetical protein